MSLSAHLSAMLCKGRCVIQKIPQRRFRNLAASFQKCRSDIFSVPQRRKIFVAAAQDLRRSVEGLSTGLLRNYTKVRSLF